MCADCDDDGEFEDISRLETDQDEPLSAAVIGAMLVTLGANIGRCLAGLGDDIAGALVSHANWESGRRRMHEQGAREIEALTGGTSD